MFEGIAGAIIGLIIVGVAILFITARLRPKRSSGKYHNFLVYRRANFYCREEKGSFAKIRYRKQVSEENEASPEQV